MWTLYSLGSEQAGLINASGKALQLPSTVSEQGFGELCAQGRRWEFETNMGPDIDSKKDPHFMETARSFRDFGPRSQAAHFATAQTDDLVGIIPVTVGLSDRVCLLLSKPQGDRLILLASLFGPFE